ncbi:MAG: DUF3311 domain-containing protein [Nocardioidaceae bacterium]
MADVAAQPLNTRDKTVVGVLLLIPLLALLIVPIYARSGPELLGFPFFYWYQFVWVLLASAFTQASYVVIKRARHEGGDR